MHLNANQIARLHFANLPAQSGPDAPASVQLQFLDSNGNVLIQSAADVVMPGRTTSLIVFGEDLAFPPGSPRVGIRAVVKMLDARARGIATLEIEDTISGSQFLLHDQEVIAAAALPVRSWCFGPVGLRSLFAGERSVRFNAVNQGTVNAPGEAATMLLEIKDINFKVVAEKTVTLDVGQTGSVDFDGGIYDGIVFGFLTYITDHRRAYATVTLEVLDHNIGTTVTVATGWNQCRGYSDGGPTGGGGY